MLRRGFQMPGDEVVTILRAGFMEDDNGLTHPAGLSNPSSVQKPVLNRRRVMMKSNNFTSFFAGQEEELQTGKLSDEFAPGLLLSDWSIS